MEKKVCLIRNLYLDPALTLNENLYEIMMNAQSVGIADMKVEMGDFITIEIARYEDDK